MLHNKIIINARKSLLFHKNQSLSKRNTDSVFDVTMGSFDGAEVCELVGLFILNSLQERFGENVGLYRDDGLGVVNTQSGRLCDKERKELIRIFNDFGLKITVQTNQQRTNFLDLALDLTEGIYKSYRKPTTTLSTSTAHQTTHRPLYANSPILSTDGSTYYLAIRKRLTKQHKPTTML